MTQVVSEPKFKFQFSPTTNPLSTPSWVDISKYVLSFETNRGRQFELDRIEAGTATVVLDNTTRKFDPTNSSSEFYPHIVPMKKFQALAAGALPTNAASPLTVSGNEITDAVRATNAQGDGLSSDSSFGIWPAATNLVTNGGFETNTTGWSANGTGVALSQNPESKFGSHCLMIASGTSVTQRAVTTPISSGTIGNTYTASCWAKAATGQTVGKTFQLQIFEPSGSSGTIASITLTGTFQRVTVTRTLTTTGNVQVFVGLGSGGATGDVQLVDGVQLELGPIATPYIETNGATATRSAGRVQAPVSLLTGTQGWVAARIRYGFSSTSDPYAGSGIHLFYWATDGNNRLQGFYDPGQDKWIMRNIIGGVTTQAQSATLTPTIGSTATVIFAWTSTQVKISVNGSSFVAATPASRVSPTGTTFDIGSASGGQEVASDVFWLACGTGTLSDADAATIAAFPTVETVFNPPTTTGASVDASSMCWPANASMTAVWTANTSTYRIPTDAPVYTGFFEEWPQTWEGPSWSESECTLVDAFEALSLANITSGVATLTTAFGSNKDITYTAVDPGAGANVLTIAYNYDGPNTPLTASLSGTDIIVHLGTDNIGQFTSTANDIISCVNTTTVSGSLVVASLASGSNGTGIPGTFLTTHLAGGTFASELSGARIGHVLDNIGYPNGAGDRTLDAGQISVANSTFISSDDEKALTHIRDVENSELGYIFVNPAGSIVYHDRNHRVTATTSITSQAVFGDDSSLAELEYIELTPAFNKLYIYNQISITPDSSTVAQIASDATSIAQYMLRTYSINTLLTNTTDALALAQYILGYFKQPQLRFESMTIQPLTSIDLWLQAFSREIGDRISVRRRPPDYSGGTLGPVMSQDSFVEAVMWKIMEGDTDATIQYMLSPISSVNVLKLDDATLGKLDSGNTLSL